MIYFGVFGDIGDPCYCDWVAIPDSDQVRANLDCQAVFEVEAFDHDLLRLAGQLIVAEDRGLEAIVGWISEQVPGCW